MECAPSQAVPFQLGIRSPATKLAKTFSTWLAHQSFCCAFVVSEIKSCRSGMGDLFGLKLILAKANLDRFEFSRRCPDTGRKLLDKVRIANANPLTTTESVQT